MRLIVVSDSHGRRELLQKALVRYPCDAVIHLGDHYKDIQSIVLPENVRVESVRGNCDVGGVEEKIVEMEGKKILITHGHRYGVKGTLDALRSRMKEAGADIALYGHTHVPEYEFYGRGLILNPGALCGNRTDGRAGFAYLEWKAGGQVYIQMTEV